MKHGHLSEYFEGVGVKILSAVDAEPKSSNQHEIGTTVPMRKFLGTAKSVFQVTYVWINDEQESVTDHGFATHYDCREGKPRSAEYRLYYPSNAVTDLMSAGDTLFLAIRPDKSLLFIVVTAGSPMQRQLMWLFGLEAEPGTRFAFAEIEPDGDRLDFIARYVLDEIGVEYEDPNANSHDSIIERFGMSFPTTAELSGLARLTLPEVDAREDADFALMSWLDHEEALFRRLEKKIVADRVKKGFIDGDDVDVDEFIKYSLSVQNRRKSRMGHSLEHHLKAVFDAFELRYDSQVITEKGKKPDFIFPGKTEYFDPRFETSLLTMLAAKSSCKDRWSQILPEAERIKQKHLVTLEPAISKSQTETMMSSNVQLIVPARIHDSYLPEQLKHIWSLSKFVEAVQDRQNSQ